MKRLALPVAAVDFARPRRRTAYERAALAVTVTFLLAFACVQSGRGSSTPKAPLAGGTVVPVIDLSGSISVKGYGAIRGALAQLVHQHRRVGLVFFSDSVQEALPPGTAAVHLLPFVRSLANVSNPWSTNFSAGTSIAPGLALARRMLDRAGGGEVLLLSDLQDSTSDLAELRRVLRGYAHDPNVRLRVLPLPGATAASTAVYRRALGGGVSRSWTPAPLVTRRQALLPHSLFLWTVAALAVLLAASEVRTRPLHWRSVP